MRIKAFRGPPGSLSSRSVKTQLDGSEPFEFLDL